MSRAQQRSRQAPVRRPTPSKRPSRGAPKGRITIDGTDGFLPAALVYTDGHEVLRVRFQGDWL